MRFVILREHEMNVDENHTSMKSTKMQEMWGIEGNGMHSAQLQRLHSLLTADKSRRQR